jgi:hypothetical protein
MKSRAILVVAAIAALVSAASADTIVFDTFSANQGHDIYAGYSLGTTYATQYAIPFHPAQSGYFSELYAPVRLSAGTNQLKFSILNSSGSLPGTILEDITITGQMTSLNSSLVHGIAAGTTWLDSTQKYWLMGRAPVTTPTTTLQWYNNNQSPLATNTCYYRYHDTGTWTVRTNITAPAFSIAVLPEPASLSLLGLVGLLVRNTCRGRRC